MDVSGPSRSSLAYSRQPPVTGIVVLATGAYFLLGLRLVKGFRRYFRGSGRVVFYFHSDNDPTPYLPANSEVRHVHTAHRAWPSVAKSKYRCILAAEAQMRADGVEQVCYIDADSNFCSEFSDDWLPPVDLFGAQHFCNAYEDYGHPTFETNPASAACLNVGRETEGLLYYYGCIWGGQIDVLLGLCRVCKAMTDRDEAQGLHAVWDDESYLNKYLHDCRSPDAVILDRALPFAVSDKGGMEGTSRSLSFDLREHHEALLACRNQPISLRAGKVVPSPDAVAPALGIDDPSTLPLRILPPALDSIAADPAAVEDLGTGRRPESLSVLCTLCRPGGSREEVIDAVAGLHTEGQWQSLIAIAIEHDVAPLLAFRLIDRVPDELPAPLRKGLEIYLEGERLSGIAAADQLGVWLQELAAAGIDAMRYKGPRLARDLHGAPGLRSSLDLDVLLPRDRIDDALRGLTERGFTMRMGRRRIARQRVTGYEYLLFHPELMPVEPHWALTSHHQAFEIDYAALWRESHAGEFEGVPCRIPSVEWEVLLLCLHGGKHQWYRLKWLCDLTALIVARPDLNWRTLQVLAARQGCSRVLHLGLLLAQRMLGLVVPDSIAAEVANDRGARLLADHVVRRMHRGCTHHPTDAEQRRYLWRLRERRRDRIRYAFRRIFVPRPEHYDLVPLPAVLEWAYYPLKLIVDYALRPLHPVLRPWYRRHWSRPTLEG